MQGPIVGVQGTQRDFVCFARRDAFHLRNEIKLEELIDQVGGLDVAREDGQGVALEHNLICSPQ